MRETKNWTRREVLAMATGVGGFTLASPAIAQNAKREFTPSVMMGPFYPQIKPLDQDADLTTIRGQKTRAEGQVVHIAGRVTNVNGQPIRNAKIEIWQADSHGRYSHKSDPNKAPLDTNFQGYCVLKTDSDGRYRFKTVRPGPYPAARAGMRAPHIHFDVQGMTDRLVTQIFFPNEKLNEADSILQGIKNESVRALVIAKELLPTKDIGPNETLFGWDCVLLTG